MLVVRLDVGVVVHYTVLSAEINTNALVFKTCDLHSIRWG